MSVTKDLVTAKNKVDRLVKESEALNEKLKQAKNDYNALCNQFIMQKNVEYSRNEHYYRYGNQLITIKEYNGYHNPGRVVFNPLNKG